MANKPSSLNDPYQAALKLLTRREHSAYELRHKLLSKQFESELIESTLQKLQENNFQSDTRYVEMLLRSRQSQGYGPLRIKQELEAKGISNLLQEEFLLPEDNVWFELARTVRTKKFGSSTPQDFKTKAKQMKFLQYRGFTMGQIQASFDPE